MTCERGRDGQSGVSLLEATMLTAVVAIMSVILFQTLRGLTSTQKYTEGQMTALLAGERVLQRVVRDIEFAVRVFPEHPASYQVLGALDLSGVAPIPGSRLPRASTVGYFEPDAPTRVDTGNTLLMAVGRQPESMTLTIGPDTVDARVDVFEFVVYCLTDGGDGRLDMQRWGSRPVARHADIQSHADIDVRTAVVHELRSRGIVYAWDGDRPFGEAFYTLTPAGQAIAMSPGTRVEGDRDNNQREILARQRLQVARNASLPAIDVPMYAQATATFPHGFEVKIDGSGTGQLVMLRLVLTSMPSAERAPNHAEIVRLVSVKQS